jgi:DNA polymerase
MMEQQQQLEILEKECLACTKCSLATLGRKQVVFGDGKAPSDIMFIGEGPGREEDEQGIPFVGRSGKLLTQIIESVGLKRGENLYIANIVKCRPPDNRDPEKSESETCRSWLDRQIEIIKPKILVLVGRVAMENILEIKGISAARGNWYKYKDIDTTVIFHPSYLLRNPSKEKGKPKWLTWEDMKAIKSAAEYYKMETKT